MARFTLMGKIGEGGMGVVYRARQERLGREVAVKVLRAEMSRDADRRRRFEREVSACIRLAHPNIIKILDSGELDGKCYYIMELLTDGQTVEEQLRHGPLPPPRAAEIAAQVLDALAYCHANHILHRDVKPGNVMLRAGGMVTLMDFGLVKDLDATTILTQVGHSVGTPRYMAPEMFGGCDPTTAVDVWAAGCLLYEMLTARAPFDGQTLLEVATRISVGEYTPVSTLVEGVPEGADELLARFLAKEPEKRWPTAVEAADAVREWAREREAKPARRTRTTAVASAVVTDGHVIADVQATPAGGSALPGATSGPPTDARGASRRRRRFRLAALLGGASLCGLVIGVLLRPHRGPPGPPAATPAVVRAVGELAVAEGASSLEVTFESALGAGLLVEAEAHTPGTPLVVRVPAELVSTAGRRALLRGLPPATRVRLRVLGPDRTELAAQDVGTRGIAPVAAELLAALSALDPFYSGQRMMDELAKAQRLRPEAGLERELADVRRRWEQHLREVYSHQRLDALTADVAPVMEALMTSDEVPAETRRQLYEQAYNLTEMEEIAARGRIAVPELAARLVTRAYGCSDAPALAAPFAIGYVTSDDRPTVREALKPAEPLREVRLDGEHVIIYSDLRRSAEMFVGTFGEGVLRVPDAVPLPAPEHVRAVELSAYMERCHPTSGIRVMVSSTRSNRRADYRTVAVLRSRTVERHVVSHAVPAALLSGRPLYVRLELAYSPVRFAFEDTVEQDMWLKWFAVAWDGDAPPVGIAPGAH